MNLGEIQIHPSLVTGWDNACEGRVAHITTPEGDTEAVELGHVGQWEYRLARLIRARWPGAVGRWLAPWLHMVIEPAEVV